MNGKDAMRAPITHVLGARPNFMKAAPVIRALAALGHDQWVVHTGQHYDERMSEVFFVLLGLPRPDVNLGVGSGSHARQTAEVLTGMESEFTENSPALAVVYGDVTNSSAHSWSVSRRLISSGIESSKLRSPASTWATGTPSLAAAIAAPRVELTSP